jgi:elongation factor G
MAGILAFRTVAEKSRPVLLEPILQVQVLAPDENLGEVMGDLSSRRGQILGTEPDGRLTRIKAMVPEAEMYKYSTQLHSITHGRGTFHAEFSSYQEAPPDVAQKVAAERAKEKEEKK